MIKKTSATNFWCNDDYDNKEIFLWEIDDVASIRDIRYLCCLSESFCTSGRYRVRDCCQSMWIDSASASCHFAHARSSFFSVDSPLSSSITLSLLARNLLFYKFFHHRLLSSALLSGIKTQTGYSKLNGFPFSFFSATAHCGRHTGQLLSACIVSYLNRHCTKPWNKIKIKK